MVMANIECNSGFRIIPFAAYEKQVKEEEKKRPLQTESPSPERAGDIFKKLVCGDDKSPPEQKKKRPKTE